jgi:ABC-type transport system involved in multi-copper enzyme maturation permease subunit
MRKEITMIALVRAELIKLFSTRTFFGLVAGAVAVVLLGSASTIISANPQDLRGPLHEQTFYVLASINGGLFALVLGVRGFTDEFRYGTIITTLLSARRRFSVLGAKLIVAALAAATMAIVTEAAMSATAAMLSSARGAEVTVSAADIGAFAGMVGAFALWAAIGTTLVAIVRHQVAAIVGGLVWVLVIENIGSSLLGDAGRYLPGQAAHALADAPVEALASTMGGIVLVAYALVATVAAARTLVGRDVT